MTKIENYIDLRKRLAELDCVHPTDVAVLPENIEHASDRTELYQTTSALTLTKLLKEQGLSVSDIYGSNPAPQFRVERSFSELIPTIFVAATYIVQNPAATLMLLNAIEAFCRTQLTVGRENKQVKLSIVKEEKEGASYLKLNYEGPESGLRDIPSILKSEKPDE